MKRIIALILIFLSLSQASYAHVFPQLLDLMSSQEIRDSLPDINGHVEEKERKVYKLPPKDFYYIRILPSPILEGYASYEFCPLIQDENKDRFLIRSARQRLQSNNYYHELILLDCKRPYQMDPAADPIYFDLRELDDVLGEDDRQEMAKMVAIAAVGLAVGGATFYIVPTFLMGGIVAWEFSGEAMDVTEEILDHLYPIHRDNTYPIQQDDIQMTRVEYFMGEHGKGSDMNWPIVPTEVETFGECHMSCKARKYKEYEMKRHQDELSEKSLYFSNLTISPTESISNQDPMARQDKCALECFDRPNVKRMGMKQVWEDLFLKTIYKAGNKYVRGRGPVNPDIAETDDLYLLMKRYHEQKRFDLSAWKPVIDDRGNIIPNHYTHITNAWYRDNNDELCDYTRKVSHVKYKQFGGKLPLDQWMMKVCSYDNSKNCREFYDSPVQTGNEICTGLSE